MRGTDWLEFTLHGCIQGLWWGPTARVLTEKAERQRECRDLQIYRAAMADWHSIRAGIYILCVWTRGLVQQMNIHTLHPSIWEADMGGKER